MPVSSQKDLVADIKAQLVAKGQTFTTNCDAFQITGRVAWALRDRGAMLIKKSAAQNGCVLAAGPFTGQKVSHDAIAFPDGWVDLLVSAGPPANVNGPAWDWHDAAAPPPTTVLLPYDLDAGQPLPVNEDDEEPGEDEPIDPTLYETLTAIALQLKAIPKALQAQAADLDAIKMALAQIRERQEDGLTGALAYRMTLKPPEK